MINECVLALLTHRIPVKEAATPVQMAKAAARFALPPSAVEAFRRLADPAGVGVRARRWQRRRPFFLLRAREHPVLSRLPYDLFQHTVMFANED